MKDEWDTMIGHIPTGTHLYGRVDNIPGVGYLATEFNHLGFVPLSPVQSWLVLHTPGVGGFFKARSEWRGLAIPTPEWKSVWAAWARSAAALYAIWSLFFFIVPILDEVPASGRWRGAVAAVLFLGIWVSSRITRASHARAVELLRRADAPESVVKRVEAAYGRAIEGTWAGRSEREVE